MRQNHRYSLPEVFHTAQSSRFCASISSAVDKDDARSSTGETVNLRSSNTGSEDVESLDTAGDGVGECKLGEEDDGAVTYTLDAIKRTVLATTRSNDRKAKGVRKCRIMPTK